MARSSSTILILTEDYYGPEFFKDLVDRLKRERFIEVSQRIKSEWFPGKCNPKLTRMLIPKSHILCKIIVVVDAEGGSKVDAKNRVNQHIPDNLKPVTKYIVFSYCIEEWICEGLGIGRSSYQHPVDCLNDHLRNTKGEDYEKHMLPDFVEEIDITRLLNNNQEFRDFLNYLKH